MNWQTKFEKVIRFIDENPEVCREALKADMELRARGLDLKECLKGSLAIIRKGGTQEQVNAYARDYGQGEAKPIEAYL